MPVDDVEEVIENKLELDNPHLDLEVDIDEEEHGTAIKKAKKR